MADERLTDEQVQLLAYRFEVERFRAAAAHRDHPEHPVFIRLEYSVFDMATRALDELQAARLEIARLRTVEGAYDAYWEAANAEEDSRVKAARNEEAG